MTGRVYTVVRVKAATPDPRHGSVVSVLAVDGDGATHEWQTSDRVTVGDRYRVSVHAEDHAGEQVA